MKFCGISKILTICHFCDAFLFVLLFFIFIIMDQQLLLADNAIMNVCEWVNKILYVL